MKVWIVMERDDWPWAVYATQEDADAHARAYAERGVADWPVLPSGELKASWRTFPDRQAALDWCTPAVLEYDVAERFDPACRLSPYG